MKQEKEKEIVLLEQAIACFQQEIKEKDALLQSQTTMIQTLEEYNKKLIEMITKMLHGE